jgi:uncharacterized protein (DUF2236 family)
MSGWRHEYPVSGRSMNREKDGSTGRATLRTLERALGLTVPPLASGTRGDPGLFGPGSVVWAIGRERVLLMAGPAALLMQLAHPLVAAGVAGHSRFRHDPLARLEATLDAVLTISFGDRPQAEAAAARVAATHGRVKGRLGVDVGPFVAGTAYDALDPELALWVYATLVYTAIQGYVQLVGPFPVPLRERYYQESKRFAAMFGVTREALPETYADFRRYVDSMVTAPTLAVGPQAGSLALDVLYPPLPTLARLAGPLVRLITAGLLPSRLRDAFGLRWRPADRHAFRMACATVRAALRALPQAARRWPHEAVALARMPGDSRPEA